MKIFNIITDYFQQNFSQLITTLLGAAILSILAFIRKKVNITNYKFIIIIPGILTIIIILTFNKAPSKNNTIDVTAITQSTTEHTPNITPQQIIMQFEPTLTQPTATIEKTPMSAHTTNVRQARIHYEKGEEYNNSNDYDNAILEYTKAIQYDDNYTEAYNRLAVNYFLRGANYLNNNNDYDRAIAYFTETIRIKPNFGYYFSRGYVYYLKEDYNRAISDYTDAIRLCPNNDEYGKKVLFYERGLAYYARGDIDHAIKDYENALKIDPYYTEARDALELLTRDN